MVLDRRNPLSFRILLGHVKYTYCFRKLQLSTSRLLLYMSFSSGTSVRLLCLERMPSHPQTNIKLSTRFYVFSHCPTCRVIVSDLATHTRYDWPQDLGGTSTRHARANQADGFRGERGRGHKHNTASQGAYLNNPHHCTKRNLNILPSVRLRIPISR
jgi:hypothetical protein